MLHVVVVLSFKITHLVSNPQGSSFVCAASCGRPKSGELERNMLGLWSVDDMELKVTQSLT